MTLPILLIPGLNCTSEVWASQTPALWSRGPVTIANHTIGSSISEIAANILAAAPPSFALGGISMGGYIAFEVWRQAPQRVRGLALVDTSARPDTPEATERRRAAMALAGQGKFAQVIAAAFPLAVHPDNVENAAMKALHTRMGLAIGLETYLRQQQAIIGRPDSRPDFGAIEVPTIVLVGDKDAITPPEVAQEMADGIRGAALTTIPNAGHMALVEQPEAVNAALLSWLDGLSR
ncbi:alpha/beta fold hydrolase [Devosia sp.]|uniref:alpha/beta fold hydrolase n=1 Tax=Devosia sp. TaxID=1871048 RepID=UPI003BAB4FEA